MQKFLRDKVLPTELTQWSERVEQLRLVSQSSDLRAQCIALGRLGDELRRHPEFLKESVDVLNTALTLAYQYGESWRSKDAIIASNLIRLATSLQYSGCHQNAIEVFDQSLLWIRANSLSRYEDFALQHMGKCFAEIGKVRRARQCFMQALEQRYTKGDDQLIESTRRSIGALIQVEQEISENAKA